MIDLVKFPVLTEKASKLLEQNQYFFEVDRRLTKPQVKATIESLFDVKVVGINSYIPPVKKRRLGRFLGSKPSYKRVILTLNHSDSIPFFPQS